jgi:HAD superfamily hydrolase (TIGR01549 family)
MYKIRNALLYCTLILLSTSYHPLTAPANDTAPSFKTSNEVTRVAELPRSTTAHIIFDLGGVLIDTKKASLVWRLGPKRLAFYWFFTGKSPHALRQTLYTVMNSVERRYDNTPRAYDDAGLLIPSLMYNWLSGRQTNEQILSKLTHAIALHPEWFINHAEQIIIQKLIEIMFTPKKFIATRTFISKGIHLVKACKEKGFKVYILSNWDVESFELLREQNPSVFNLFDGIVISGQYNCLKPNPELYQIFLNRFNLHPRDCVMIDDRIENIQTARALDIHSIHYASSENHSKDGHNFKAIEKEIIAWVRYTAKEKNSCMTYVN